MEEVKNEALSGMSDFSKSFENSLQVDFTSFASIYESISEASEGSVNQRFIRFFKPAFFVAWGFYLVTLAKLVRHIKNQLSVRAECNDGFVVNAPETIYTASKKAFQGSMPIRFFGVRFIAIWIFPLVITGAVIEFLFASPLRGVSPFS